KKCEDFVAVHRVQPPTKKRSCKHHEYQNGCEHLLLRETNNGRPDRVVDLFDGQRPQDRQAITHNDWHAESRFMQWDWIVDIKADAVKDKLCPEPECARHSEANRNRKIDSKPKIVRWKNAQGAAGVEDRKIVFFLAQPQEDAGDKKP